MINMSLKEWRKNRFLLNGVEAIITFLKLDYSLTQQSKLILDNIKKYISKTKFKFQKYVKIFL